MSAEQKESEKIKEQIRKRKSRETQSEEKRKAANAKSAATMKEMRADQSVEKRAATKTKDAAAKKGKRVSQKTSVEKKEALRTRDYSPTHHPILVPDCQGWYQVERALSS